jgi:1,4-dihydroxy-6-naphthoate synthase
MESQHKLLVGFSPCPNDTFIFDAIINNKIDTEGLNISYIIADVEDLNKKALFHKLDVTKLSFQTFFKVKAQYTLLNAGCALGNNCGPILISKKKHNAEDLKSLKIAIPGKNTTANLLLRLAFPEMHDKVEMLFSDIEDSIISKKVDAGVIIHESRFTYEKKGLMKLIDLGEFWEKITNCPIPLGCIAIKKNFSDEIRATFDRVLRRSVEFAINNPNSSYDFVKKHAQEMDDDVIRKHIDLYVNKYSLDLGVDGKKAIDILENYFNKF